MIMVNPPILEVKLLGESDAAQKPQLSPRLSIWIGRIMAILIHFDDEYHGTYCR